MKQRKSLVMVVLGLGVLVVSSASFATTFWIDTDSLESQTPNATVNTPWEKFGNCEAIVLQEGTGVLGGFSDFFPVGGKGIRTIGTGYGGVYSQPYGTNGLTSTDGTVVYEFYFRASGDSILKSANAQIYGNDVNGNAAFQFRFGDGTNKYLKYWNGTASYWWTVDMDHDGNYDTDDELVSGHWYHFKVTVSVDEDNTLDSDDTFTLQWRDLGTPDNLNYNAEWHTAQHISEGENMSCAKDVNKFDRFTVKFTNSVNDYLYVDTPLPEPATVGLFMLGTLGLIRKR